MKFAWNTKVLGITFSALLSSGLGTAIAGDSIIIGAPKDRSEPGKEGKVDKGLFGKNLSKIDTDPLHGLNPGIPSSSGGRKSKLEERRQNAADEKKNFLLLNEGDLQKDDESNFGVNERAFSADGLEKEEKSRNYTFFTPTKSGKKNAKQDAEALRKGRQARQNEESENLLKTDKSVSAHTVPELNFQKMFEPSKSESALGPSKALTLESLFSKQSSPMEDKAFVGSAPAKSWIGGSSSPAGIYRSSSPALDFKPAVNPAPAPFFPAATPSLPTLPSQSDQGYGRPSFYPSAPAPARNESERAFTPPPREIPRRAF